MRKYLVSSRKTLSVNKFQLRAFSQARDLKRSLSNPRTSGTWPDEVVEKGVAAEDDRPASDADLIKCTNGILRAQCKIYEVCKETQLQFAPGLSKLLGNEIFLKREDQQPVFSFKIRGAFNKIASLSEEKKQAGIVTCSAGNHAQGVAFCASRLGLNNLIVMPKGTPKIKVDSVKKFGGNVLLVGKDFDEAQAVAIEHSEKSGMTLIHPFDDMDVICGQGTIGIEILKEHPATPDAIFSSVGGGGLLAGVGCYTKQLSPETRVIGVETFDANAMTRSLQQKKRILLNDVGLFADGAAIRIPGKSCFSLAMRVIDEVVNVSTDDVCQAIKSIFNDTRCVVEPAGALGVAGMIRYVEENNIKDQSLVCVLTGANMDFDRLRFVSERADRSESLFHIRIPEKQESFYEWYKLIYPRYVTEVSYRMKSGPNADIMVSFRASSPEDKEDALKTLNEGEFEATDLSDNELAKTHIRHLAAGRVSVPDERVLMFEFPESPGALNMFLTKLSKFSQPTFNISLFHYRDHGNDVGRVLIGIQVPKHEEEDFDKFLSSLEFYYTEETNNPAYVSFLRN